jgi:exonuclease SbcC
MGLTVFDQLYTISNDKFKETNTLLKNISKDQLIDDLQNVSGSIDLNNQNISRYNSDIKDLEVKKEEHNNNLLELSNNIIRTATFDFDIVELESEKTKLDANINTFETDISEKKSKFSTNETQLFDLSSSLKSCENIENDYDQYKICKEEESKKSSEIEKLKAIVKNKIDKLKKLEEHKYDPNCTYCVNNVFVKDAIKTKEEIELDKSKGKILVEQYNISKNKLDSFGDIESRYKECQRVNSEKVKLEKTKEILSTSILRDENFKIKLQNDLNGVIQNIDTFYKNRDIIENNAKLIVSVNEVKTTIKNIESDIKSVNNKLFNASTEKGKLELQYKNTTDQLNKVKELESSYEAYKLYTNIISRDGIPYEIITRTLPEIEKEVNNILQQIVEFSITLQTDGKNIMTNIVYDDRRWPLEMASGMEKFVSGLAIRVSLINISNLPRPNIICIDEGFGCADSDHLSQMGALFSYLKHQFDFIWVISHLDQMRDMVDEQIEIKKDNGFSKVVYK